jgi:2',3'-cyclic-nucleotide 2'-phosphodiesterase (5'-nucleotidase family)
MGRITAIIVNLVMLNLPASGADLIIIYSNNTNGILENCQCPDHAYGALEKRATVIDSFRTKYQNVLLLDAGDILDIRQNTLLHSSIVHAYEILKYDALTCGDQDFVEGPEFFKKLEDHPHLPLVSTNILRGRDVIGQEYIIKTFGRLRIGITGTIHPGFYRYLNIESQKSFIFIEQISALRKILGELRSKCDYLILLSHSGYENDLKLAEQFPQIDLIVGGHSQTLLSEEEKRGFTCIVQAGENGYRLGILSLRFEENKLVECKNKLILLDSETGNNPRMMELIQSYHQELSEKKREIKIPPIHYRDDP